MQMQVKLKKPSTTLKRTIRARMALRGLSESDLSKLIGRKRHTVNRAINHGENAPTLELVLAELGIKR